MKKAVLMAMMITTALISCTKEETPTPQPPKADRPLHEIGYFTEQNLPGVWTRYRERIEGTNLFIDHQVTEMEIPITMSYWYSPGLPLTFDGSETITVHMLKRLGSDESWKINWGSNDAFTLTNVVDTGYYAGTVITDYLKRVED